MLALIAGSGGLPAHVAAARSERPLICALEGYAPDGLAPDMSFRIEKFGSFLKDLRKRGVTEVCLCGAVARPRVDLKAIDMATLPLVTQMQKGLQAGDDGALRVVLDILASKGFTVRAAHELAPGLLAPPGVLSRAQPDKAMRADVDRAVAVLDALAPHDVGQGCVVGAGQVAAIETIGGTDHMLATLPKIAARLRAVLVKRPKRGQDRRVDLPTVGPATLDAIQAAGLAGLVIDAGDVLLLDRDEAIARADRHGLVLWSRDPR
ncbi:UDP-2,3-diacylglucosamine diphosphatase LpxI [Sulfitobacter sp. D35]|uniref:LpxI family protein n=1 Tax=Sulfitobacter sp. D35 TaxID=3083252 RepID=UPI00296E88C6|nr:UDP-2,3-diacylglucosamine diphosphatase LpxI [Sulfitobacter sp. D35]MDW4497741.1 UDP-2,3-diacylglucosamine diphosphatase LpxI [Sulfitobacter sp. D35]